MAIGKVAAEQTRKSKTSLKDDLRKEMFESNEKKLSAQYYKKVLLSGEKYHIAKEKLNSLEFYVDLQYTIDK